MIFFYSSGTSCQKKMVLVDSNVILPLFSFAGGRPGEGEKEEGGGGGAAEFGESQEGISSGKSWWRSK